MRCVKNSDFPCSPGIDSLCVDCHENMNPQPAQAEGFDGCTCSYVGANCRHCRKQAEEPILGELYGRTKEGARVEILDRMKYHYFKTDGTYEWPNSAEGDLLKMVYGLLTSV